MAKTTSILGVDPATACLTRGMASQITNRCRVALGYHYIDGGSSLLANEHEYIYKINKEKTSRISYENEIPLSKVINQETTGATKARINTKTDLYNNNKRGISKPERKGTKREQVRF